MICNSYYRSPITAQRMGTPSPVRVERGSGRSLSSRTYTSLGLLFVVFGLCPLSQAQRDYTYNPKHFDAVKIIQAMRTPHPDLRIISAHRGLHAIPGDNPSVPGVPENSLASVAAAAQAGLEVLELDVKLTSDKQLTFSHDRTWGRQAVDTRQLPAVFDPFTPPTTPNNQLTNPVVANLTLADTQQFLRLRDSVSFRTPTNPEFPPTLQQVISFYEQHQIATVLALDIKDVETFKYTWAAVKAAPPDYLGHPFFNSVVFKIGGYLYKTPAALKADFPSDFGSINYWPNYNTVDIDASRFGSEQAIIDSLNSFYQDPSLSIISAEITQKQPFGILNQMRAQNLAAGRSVAQFSANGDYFDPQDSSHTAQFFNSADGSCCTTLDRLFYNNPVPGQPSDTADVRGDFYFVQGQGFNIITADFAVDWASKLSTLGYRILSYIREDSYPEGAICNPGNGKYPGCDAEGTTVYTYCQAEGQTCSFAGARVVAYGANGNYNFQTIRNSTVCSASVFRDPAPGVAKACYYGPAIGSPLGQLGQPSVYCADDGGVCSFNGTAIGIYGIGREGLGGNFVSVPSKQNSFSCSSTSFSDTDPAPGSVKTCFYQLSSGNLFAGPSGYVLCANEGQTCQFAGKGRVAFGANGAFYYQTPVSGVACSTAIFGDPLYGVGKACYVQYALGAQYSVDAQFTPPPGLPTTRPIKILVDGDSMTAGREGDYTWRFRLTEWLARESIPYQFVGPTIGVSAPQPVQPPHPITYVAPSTPMTGTYSTPGTLTFDSNHAAAWGKPFATAKDKIAGLVQQYQPDLVLVALGFNDMGWFYSDDMGALASMETYVQNARSVNSNLQFVVADVPYRTYIGGRDDLITKTTSYDTNLSTVASGLETATSKVGVAGFNANYGCDPHANTCPSVYDGLHPNYTGDFRIAQAFASALHAKFGMGGNATLSTPTGAVQRPLAVPTNLKFDGTQEGVTVTWDRSYGATGYDVQWRERPLAGTSTWGAWQTSSSGFERWDLSWQFANEPYPDYDYQVMVAARYGDVNNGFATAFSTPVEGVPQPTVSASPTNVTVSPITGGFDVFWNAPTGAYSASIYEYDIWAYDQDTPTVFSKIFSSTTSQNAGVGPPHKTITGLTSGHHYSIMIEAWNPSGTSKPAVVGPFIPN